MRKKAAIYALLLLPFWLGALAFNYTDVFGVGADPCDYQSDSSGDSGQSHENSNGDVTLVRHAFQHLSRRVDSVQDKRFLSATDTIADKASVSKAGSNFSLVECPAELPHSWQFYLRVASEPRAPSLVS